MTRISLSRAALPGTILVLALTAACSGDRGIEERPGRHAGALSADVVDSARPTEESLRGFRAGLRDAPTVLRGGATSRDSLVGRFIAALERADTAALRQLVLAKAEFAYLVYPSSPYVRAPYRQAPEIVWLQLEAGSEKGLTRLLRRLGGRALGYVGHDCPAAPVLEGSYLLWRDCVVRLSPRTAPDTASSRLFGVILERDGRFKFVSYSNDL